MKKFPIYIAKSNQDQISLPITGLFKKDAFKPEPTAYDTLFDGKRYECWIESVVIPISAFTDFNYCECDSIIFNSNKFEQLHYYKDSANMLAPAMLVIHKHELSSIPGNYVYKPSQSRLKFLPDTSPANLSIYVKWIDLKGNVRHFNFENDVIKLVLCFSS